MREEGKERSGGSSSFDGRIFPEGRRSFFVREISSDEIGGGEKQLVTVREEEGRGIQVQRADNDKLGREKRLPSDKSGLSHS